MSETGFTIEQHRDELIERLGVAIKRMNAAEAEVAKLREAVLKYGLHKADCAGGGRLCTCGFYSVRKSAKEQR